MRLSTKGHYAVTAMLDLCIHDHSGPVTLLKISRCQGISLSYLEQLFAKLRKSNLVKGVRGPGGGYCMARPASEISVADIIIAVDERMDATQCAGRQNCQEGEVCLTHELWLRLSDKIYQYLDGITLQQFMDRPSTRALIEQQRKSEDTVDLKSVQWATH